MISLSLLLLLQAASPPDLAITHVTLIDGTDPAPRPDQTVVLRGRHIVAVGPASATAVPRGSRVLEGRGRFLVPGLWDMHVHSAASAEREFPVYLALGVTGLRNMHTTVDTALALTSAIRREVAAGRLVGPRFIANGPIIDGPRPAQRDAESGPISERD